MLLTGNGFPFSRADTDSRIDEVITRFGTAMSSCSIPWSQSTEMKLLVGPWANLLCVTATNGTAMRIDIVWAIEPIATPRGQSVSDVRAHKIFWIAIGKIDAG